MIDTYRQASTGLYLAGAITFRGRKKVEVVQWKKRTFDTQSSADDFVRSHFRASGLHEAASESELSRYDASTRR